MSGLLKFSYALALTGSLLTSVSANAQSRSEKDQGILEQRRQANPNFQAQQKQAQVQAQQALNEYRPLALATAIHEKCKSLSKLSYMAASYAKSDRRLLLIQSGAMKPRQFAEFDTLNKNSVADRACKDIAALPATKNAIQHSDFHRDFYLLALLHYDGGHVMSLTLCSDIFRTSRDKIIKATQAAKERLSKNSNFASLEADAKARANSFRSKCNNGSDYIYDPRFLLMQEIVKSS